MCHISWEHVYLFNYFSRTTFFAWSARFFLLVAKQIALCYNVSMNEMVKQVDEIISRIDFGAIWPGFGLREFVLAQNLPEDTERLAAYSVRGMFRDYQREQGDTRFPDNAALLTYPQDLDNYRLKMAENHYLVKAITDNSLMDLQQFVVLREARRRIVGAALAQEQRAETAEGLAEYAGLSALNQLSRVKFMEEMQRHLATLRNPRDLFDMRRVSHSVGCLICFALKSLNIDFYHDLSDSRTIYEFIPHLPNEIDTIFNETVKNGIYSKN